MVITMNNGQVKEIKVTSSTLKAYNAQSNVIRRTGATNLEYGTIVLMADQDYD